MRHFHNPFSLCDFAYILNFSNMQVQKSHEPPSLPLSYIFQSLDDHNSLWYVFGKEHTDLSGIFLLCMWTFWKKMPKLVRARPIKVLFGLCFYIVRRSIPGLIAMLKHGNHAMSWHEHSASYSHDSITAFSWQNSHGCHETWYDHGTVVIFCQPGCI